MVVVVGSVRTSLTHTTLCVYPFEAPWTSRPPKGSGIPVSRRMVRLWCPRREEAGWTARPEAGGGGHGRPAHQRRTASRRALNQG